jgi:hypothetical protein
MNGLTDQTSTPSGKEETMAHVLRRSTLVAGVVGCLLCGSLSDAAARIKRVELTNTLSEGNAALCEEEFPSDARATLFLKQSHGQTWLTIIVHNARPNALFTIWVFLDGISPLTGRDVTAMVRSGLVDDLVEVTPRVGDSDGQDPPVVVVTVGLQTPPFQPGDGDDTVYVESEENPIPIGGPGFGTRSVVPNGFYTNRFGWGIFTTHLDFELEGGDYPFDKVVIPGRVGKGDLDPIPIFSAAPFGPFGIASHCKDEKAHGLVNLANPATSDQTWFVFAPKK